MWTAAKGKPAAQYPDTRKEGTTNNKFNDLIHINTFMSEKIKKKQAIKLLEDEVKFIEQSYRVKIIPLVTFLCCNIGYKHNPVKCRVGNGDE